MDASLLLNFSYMRQKRLSQLLLALSTILGLLFPFAAVHGAPLQAYQGGTNIDSTTGTDAGKVLMVSTTGSGPTFKWLIS